MTSSCLTSDLQNNLNIQGIQSLNTGHAHVEISDLYNEENRSYRVYSLEEGQLQEYQINVIQMYKIKLFKIQVT